MLKLVIIALIITFTSIFVFSKLDPKLNQNNTQTSGIGSSSLVTVSISGEINRPGTFIIENGATLYDLIALAGGVKSNADMKAYNVTISLVDGKNYYIAPLSENGDACVIAPITKVNINTATKEELMTVSGIGSTIASAIITHREANGSFTYIEQIMEVSGIGNATFEKIKNFIVISN